MNPFDQPPNPYAIVREEEWTEDVNDIHIIHVKSYDAKDRVVGIASRHFQHGVLVRHFAEYVEADGYWHGGAYDAETGMGCQTCHPFIEGENIQC